MRGQDRLRDAGSAPGGVLPHRLPTPPYGVPDLLWRLLIGSLSVLALAAVADLAGAVVRSLGVVPYAVMAAVLCTTLLKPLSDALQRRRVPRTPAALLALLLGAAVVAAIAASLVGGLADSWPALQENLQAGLARLQSWVGAGRLSGVGSRLLDALRANAAELAGQVATTVGAAVHLVAGGVLATVTTFFLVRDGRRVAAAATRMLPARHGEPTWRASVAAWAALSATVRGLLLVALADGVLIGVCLAVLEVPAAAALALLAFLAAFVPVVGAVVSGAVIGLVALVGNGPTIAVFAVLAVVVVNQIDAHLLQPFIMSRTSSMHPLLVILAVAGGAALWGLAGALFAVPVAAVAIAAARSLRASGRDNAPPTPDEAPAESPRAGADA